MRNGEECLLVPIQGGLDYTDDTGKSLFICMGQSYWVKESDDFHFSVKNPYQEETICYLILRFDGKTTNIGYLNSFDILSKNVLLNVYQNDNYHIIIGIYEGRQEGEYMLKPSQRAVFTFVIHGAFEFQHRLIEKQDALILQNVSKIEFEALSKDAILCMIVF